MSLSDSSGVDFGVHCGVSLVGLCLSREDWCYCTLDPRSSVGKYVGEGPDSSGRQSARFFLTGDVSLSCQSAESLRFWFPSTSFCLFVSACVRLCRENFFTG